METDKNARMQANRTGKFIAFEIKVIFGESGQSQDCLYFFPGNLDHAIRGGGGGITCKQGNREQGTVSCAAGRKYR